MAVSKRTTKAERKEISALKRSQCALRHKAFQGPMSWVRVTKLRIEAAHRYDAHANPETVY